MSDTRFVLPDYYRIVECCGDRWHFKKISPFYTRLPFQVDFQDFELLYGISKQQVINEIARLNNQQEGFYLVNLREKRYSYCGTQAEEIKALLRSLGIGRNDPTDRSKCDE